MGSFFVGLVAFLVVDTESYTVKNFECVLQCEVSLLFMSVCVWRW